MPRSRIPSYRLHKGSRRAVVTLDGRDCYLYLGARNSPKQAVNCHSRLWQSKRLFVRRH